MPKHGSLSGLANARFDVPITLLALPFSPIALTLVSVPSQRVDEPLCVLARRCRWPESINRPLGTYRAGDCRMVRYCRLLVIAFFAILAGLLTPAIGQPANPNELIILTTTTTRDSGILRVLTDAFAKKANLTVKAIVAGSGDILKQSAWRG